MFIFFEVCQFIGEAFTKTVENPLSNKNIFNKGSLYTPFKKPFKTLQFTQSISISLFWEIILYFQRATWIDTNEKYNIASQSMASKLNWLLLVF